MCPPSPSLEWGERTAKKWSFATDDRLAIRANCVCEHLSGCAIQTLSQQLQRQMTMSAAAAPPENNISELDEANVRKLREMVGGQLTVYYDTDFNLLRWLHGHGNNLAEIVPKLRNHLHMRRSMFQLDSLADGPRNHPVHVHWEVGLTSEAGRTPNCVVNVEQTGSNDYWGMLHAFSLTDVLQARIYDLERMLRMVMERERATGHQHSILYVMDLTGLKFDRNLITLTRGALSAISAFMSEHYVELIHSFVIVNAPSFISMLWSMAKPLLPERTRNKVQILGHSWRTEILQIARPEALPAFWNEQDGEKVFLADVKRSVPIDPSTYYKPEEDPVQYRTLLVRAGKCGVAEISAEKGDKLFWQLHSDGHFCFAVYLGTGAAGEEEEEETKALVYPRINQIPGPTYVPICGQLECQHSGLYKFWFSNEHAWLHSLKIRHHIRKE